MLFSLFIFYFAVFWCQVSVFGAVLEYQPVTVLSPALFMGNMVEIF